MDLLFIDWTPDVNLLTLGSFAVRWYSALWCLGLLAAYFIVQQLYKKQGISEEKFEPLFFYCFVGVLAGARLGHCIFYEPQYYLTSLRGFLEMLLPIHFSPDMGSWKFTGYEGLASHGGTIGIILGMILYAKKVGLKMWTVIDNVAIAVPFVCFCIRMGNLMNSEIIGTPTDMPWGFIFHTREALVDGQLAPRHPAQLYEALAYLLFGIIQLYIFKRHPKRIGTSYYFGFVLTTIFAFRFFIEFVKKEQVDFEQGMLLDMGQLLSIPFVIIGLYGMIRAVRNERKLTE